MPNVLMLTDYFPPHAGGVERAVYELARRLASRGTGVRVLTLTTRRAATQESLEGVEVVRVPGFDLTRSAGAQLAVSPRAWPVLLKILETRKVDLIHAHNLFFHLSLAGALLSRASGTPLVTTAHLGPVDRLGGAYGTLAALYERSVGALILRLSHRTIAVSDAVARHARRLGARPESVIAIPNGVDTHRFSPATTNRESASKVIFVGRLIFNKGPQFLLDAIPEVLCRHPGTQFEIVGDGPMRRQLESRAARQGLNGRVRFLGERDDVEHLLRKADVFVRPSLLEGMPLTVLEAMACGLPVIATPVGGTAELVEQGVNGYLVEPGCRAELAERLCALLADRDLRREMGRRGRMLVESGYDWDSAAQKTVEVYEQALAIGRNRVR